MFTHSMLQIRSKKQIRSTQDLSCSSDAMLACKDQSVSWLCKMGGNKHVFITDIRCLYSCLLVF